MAKKQTESPTETETYKSLCQGEHHLDHAVPEPILETFKFLDDYRTADLWLRNGACLIEQGPEIDGKPINRRYARQFGIDQSGLPVALMSEGLLSADALHQVHRKAIAETVYHAQAQTELYRLTEEGYEPFLRTFHSIVIMLSQPYTVGAHDGTNERLKDDYRITMSFRGLQSHYAWLTRNPKDRNVELRPGEIGAHAEIQPVHEENDSPATRQAREDRAEEEYQERKVHLYPQVALIPLTPRATHCARWLGEITHTFIRQEPKEPNPKTLLKEYRESRTLNEPLRDTDPDKTEKTKAKTATPVTANAKTPKKTAPPQKPAKPRKRYDFH